MMRLLELITLSYSTEVEPKCSFWVSNVSYLVRPPFGSVLDLIGVVTLEGEMCDPGLLVRVPRLPRPTHAVDGSLPVVLVLGL